jgi:translation elongation factor EF-4
MLDLEKGIAILTFFKKSNGFTLTASGILQSVNTQKKRGKNSLLITITQNKYDVPTSDIVVDSYGLIKSYSSGILNLLQD